MKAISATLLGSLIGFGVAQSVLASDSAKTDEQVIHSFGGNGDGTFPLASPIYVKGVLYGTTEFGGATGRGIVFALNAKTGKESVLYSFAGGVDSEYPTTSLIDVKGMLYGVTTDGGSSGDGTVFAVNSTTGAETVVHTFAGSDGVGPAAGLIEVGGRLYGTTEAGGASEDGAVFEFNPKTQVEQVLHSFAGGGDGSSPRASLIAMNGALFGTTLYGGAYNDGVVFELNPKTGKETVLYSFGAGADGQSPYAGLTVIGGALYGTTEAGGQYDDGAAFALDAKTGAETVLHSFGDGYDGQNPFASMIAVRGVLYGTTATGGANVEGGTVFSLDPKTGTEKTLYSFGATGDAFEPFGNVINVKKTLYGASDGGGSYGEGAVFALKR